MIKSNIHAATLRFRKKVLSGYRIDVVFLFVTLFSETQINEWRQRGGQYERGFQTLFYYFADVWGYDIVHCIYEWGRHLQADPVFAC